MFFCKKVFYQPLPLRNRGKISMMGKDREAFLEKTTLPWILTKEGSHIKDYEGYFQIRYINHVEYEKALYFTRIAKLCQKAEKKKALNKERKWLGFYYDKELTEPTRPFVMIKPVNDKIGYGVFTLKNLKKGTFIGEYTGLLRKRRKRKDAKNSYCFEYIIGEYKKTPFTIDAKKQGNFTRFMNHRQKGNCDSFLVFHKGVMKVILYTNQDVKEGEELCYDYGEDYWRKREAPLL